jgi:hypothetical protein
MADKHRSRAFVSPEGFENLSRRGMPLYVARMLPMATVLALVLACTSAKDRQPADSNADDTGALPCPGDRKYETFYPDDDDDGYGRKNEPLEACQPTPSGYTLRPDDCDDTNPAAHPDQQEDCATDFDDDCDGTINLPVGVNLANCTDFYVDTDADGFGNAAEGECLCAPDETHVATAPADCDNRDAKVFLGTPTCVELEPKVWTGRVDGAKGTAPIGAYVFAADVDADGVRDAVLGDPDANKGAGALFVVLAPFTGTVALDDATVIRIDGSADAALGSGFVGPAPFVGSGAEVVAQTGAGLLVLDATSFLAEGIASPVATISNATVPTVLGDQDGDGLVELLAACETCGLAGEGAVYVVSDPPAGSSDAADVAVAEITGREDGELEHVAVADAGDMNGDGLADLAIGAPESAGGQGAAYVFLAPYDVTATLDGADSELAPDDLDIELGWELVGQADFDDDGYADLAVGSKRHGMNGGVFVLNGPPSSAKSGVDSDAILRGHPGDGHGFSMAVLDRAGPDAIAVGAPSAAFAAAEAGSVTVLVGPLSGNYNTQTDGVSLVQTASASDFGSAMATMDGADLLIGADESMEVYLVPAATFGL